ncbi:uncharacterized protein EV420DRAFT_1525759 [Desarmillaria tabescens]|uniref:Uncharacterized protein n=1 Tax=Armillaria tabescens TaxID=1929756 RepID=A0AA39NBI8_ARMTA|nr:uncharacterized protein EV420DRAFT_1525759 [Desarmillaria tabescens]KAK0462592.1 hypothetical protein EV420DRAFT_1525759 [Desarmillaria tabescens]
MPPRAKRAASSGTPPRRKKKDQYHHAIPRFILRRFQPSSGPPKSRAQRQEEYKQTRGNSENVLYYDLASGSLDVRPIGKVYGLMNLYRDASNPSNVNELEEKLGVLEDGASVVIQTLHSNLASGKVPLKRRDVGRLRKFLFVMHYRNLGGSYFDPDHPHGGSTIRQWVERYKTKHPSCQTHTDVWLSVLRYYLDTPHSQIVNDATAIYKEHGMEKVHLQMLTDTVDPNMEHYPALAYQKQAGMSFLCIWEAHDTSEFILSNNSFGLWEGVAPSGDQIHRVFVVSPQIAVVLRSNLLPMFEKMGPMNSDLIQIPQERPVSKLVNGEAGFRIPEGSDPSSVDFNRLRSPSDLFTFTITKLSLVQTDALNAVVLKNVHQDGAMTFLGKERMFRTVRSFCHDQMNKHDRPKFASLMRHLSVIPTLMGQAPQSNDPVDAELYATLMNILLDEKRFPSHYDRALSVFRLIEDTSLRMICPFMTEHIFNLSAAMQKCQTRFGGDVYKAVGDTITLESSLSEEVSSRVFQGLDQFISDKLGVRLAYDSSDVLGQVGKEVVLVAFLDWVIDESGHVLDKMPDVTMQAVQIQEF